LWAVLIINYASAVDSCGGDYDKPNQNYLAMCGTKAETGAQKKTGNGF